MKNSKRILPQVAAMLLLGVTVAGTTGCQWAKDNKAASGAIAGAVVGGAAGALIDDGGGRGILIGAAAGAAVGGGIGYYLDKQKDKLDRIEGIETSETTVDLDDGTGTKHDALRLTMNQELLFEQGSASVSPLGVEKLTEVSAVLVEFPDSTVLIKGHASMEGDASSNQELSEQRANAVRNQLVGNRVSPDRLIAVGLGSTQPVADNDTEAGRMKNRRVEIDIVPNEGAE